jgi:hypothetical protein
MLDMQLLVLKGIKVNLIPISTYRTGGAVSWARRAVRRASRTVGWACGTVRRASRRVSRTRWGVCL